MSPAIEDRDRVLIAPADPGTLPLGAIAKVVAPDGSFRLHRLIQRTRLADRKWKVRLAGDNAAVSDPWVGGDAIVGVAVAVERDGVVRRLDTLGARSRGALKAWRQRRRFRDRP